MLKFEVIPVTPFAQNCSLIWCDETHEAALIDPGGEPEKLKEALSRHGLTLRHIILTHGHLDHVGAAEALRRELGCLILGPHRDDAFWLEMLPKQSQMFGFPPTPAFAPDRWLAAGDQLTLGQQRLEVYHCPGHTPGHVVLLSRELQVAWVGDVLFAGSIGRTDFPKGDHATLIRSINETLLPLGDEVVFIPGHGPSSTLGRERVSNPYLTQPIW
ncbi:metallo-beta-lactamase family protein [Aeromonas diversa CDC 2478-85]|uniref:Metallo-beta-lactamase family protein n=1 Tax=Aeromonas diversa CDC 2478-85 TaxID=1268237 RepID=N9TW10_9GAMM|nr:MBL fold metallo-hydrolase [Aeromonas diversa]ENY70309.1 metallo-beta-lactamase family protein [Aeromonas diversa CDC 2478-85]